MPEISPPPAGVFNWLDLMSPDVDASVAFYTEVFGWEAEDQFAEDGETRVYVMFRKDGKQVAGLGGQPDPMAGAPAMWNSYVATDDADDTTVKVEAAGGTVLMPPMQVFDSGRMAIYSAPDGAVISTWQPMAHVGAEVANEPDAWSWNELMTRDLDAARPFYEQVFGWRYDTHDMGPAGTYWLAVVDDRQMAGLMAMPAGVPDAAPNHWGVFFTVADLDAAVERVEAAGGQAVGPRLEGEGIGTWQTVHDQLGASFTLIQSASADG